MMVSKTSRQNIDDLRTSCYTLKRNRIAGVVQLVERLLAKEKVVGSSPIARSSPRRGGFSFPG